MKNIAALVIILAATSVTLTGCYSKHCGCQGSQCNQAYKQ